MLQKSFFMISLLAASAMSLPCHAQSASALTAAPAAASPPAAPKVIYSLSKKDIVIGTGLTASSGANISVRYTGWLYDSSAPDLRGKMFDSTEKREPLEFQLGKGQVVKGWDQGILGMRVGGKRTLIIPSSLAYGKDGSDDTIPPNAALVFDVELVDIR